MSKEQRRIFFNIIFITVCLGGLAAYLAFGEDSPKWAILVITLIVIFWVQFWWNSRNHSLVEPKKFAELYEAAKALPVETELAADGTLLTRHKHPPLKIVISRARKADIEEALTELYDGQAVSTVPSDLIILTAPGLVSCRRVIQTVRRDADGGVKMDRVQDPGSSLRQLRFARRTRVWLVTEAELDELTEQLQRARPA
ncbi:hypothetical protein ACSDR0_47025 [Streptosporangium sp. G11]|uniref:hypothetical protein n=1 Tax=Streptosporangium sp. G11 TaxID=3436926 RepID=UPI003EBFFDC3